MGAEVDTTEKSFFISDKLALSSGAFAFGTPNYAGSIALRPTKKTTVRDSKIYTWLVCPHLSQPDLVYRYYIASGLITIVLGKCFCETCYDMVLSTGDLSELIETSRLMTDKLFQKNFISPLIESNNNFTQILGYTGDSAKAPKTWVSCSHLATNCGLNNFYARGGQIFIFESYFTCQDCFDKIPTASLIDLLYAGEFMTDALFNEKIIESLYSINYQSLKAMGHFNLRDVQYSTK